MSFNFVFDRRNDARPYPNLAPMVDSPHESYHGIGNTFPFIVPYRLLYFCRDHNYPHNVSYIDEPLPSNALYPVGIGWFDFTLDYFALMSEKVLEYCRRGELTILFYYHEGDNPYKQKERLDSLCAEHNLPIECYYFISGNTVADTIPNFIYFPDHELFYWRNSVVWNYNIQPGGTIHDNSRQKKFTLLSRIHKWWRGTIVSYLHRENMLADAYWSYNNLSINDLPTDNPIELYRFEGLEEYIDKFLEGTPYTCDTASSTDHNTHWKFIPEHYENSYFSVVLETLYDADRSGGTFITEKTFKAIRHGHPFIIFGPPNTLKTLKLLGYKTFDNVIDNSYDSEIDNTERFIKTINSLKDLLSKDLHNVYQECKEDLLYNQNLFVTNKTNRLNNLLERLKK